MIPNAGSKLLYPASTGLEKAMADTEAERLMSLAAELVIDVWDPFAIAERNLPFLAWAHHPPLWEDRWTLQAKREWTANLFQFHALRGTVEAHRMALAPSGYDLLEYLARPVGFFATPDLSPREFNRWLRRMPEVRIYLGSKPGVSLGDEFFADDGFCDVHCAALDDGWELHGRYAILRQNGVDTPLKTVKYVQSYKVHRTKEIDQFMTPGRGGLAFFCGDFESDDRFVDAEDVEPKIYTVEFDRTAKDTITEVKLSTIQPSLKPYIADYERNSDIGDASLEFFAGDGFADNEVAGYNDAPLMLADRVYLHDPSIPTPMTEGISFAGIDRVDMPPFTIELMIDLHTRANAGEWFGGETFVDDGFAIPFDSTDWDQALRAVVAAKGFNDRALVTFETVRPWTIKDRIPENARSNGFVRATL